MSKTFRLMNRCNVSPYFEAETYVAWAGARLSIEMEWEKACAWDLATNTQRRYPLESQVTDGSPRQPGWKCAESGAYPAGMSAYGAVVDAGRCLGVG